MEEREFKDAHSDDQLHALYASIHVNKRMLRQILAQLGDGKVQLQGGSGQDNIIFVPESTFKKRLAKLTKKWTRDNLKKSVERFYREAESKKGGIVALTVPAMYASMTGELREGERFALEEAAIKNAIGKRLHNRRSRVKLELAEFIIQMSG